MGRNHYINLPNYSGELARNLDEMEVQWVIPPKRTFLENVDKWQFKKKSEIEALDDDQLKKLYEDLSIAVKEFKRAKIPPTDEMVWQLLTVPSIVRQRNLI